MDYSISPILTKLSPLETSIFWPRFEALSKLAAFQVELFLHDYDAGLFAGSWFRCLLARLDFLLLLMQLLLGSMAASPLLHLSRSLARALPKPTWLFHSRMRWDAPLRLLATKR